MLASLFFILSLRFDVGWDYMSYIDAYSDGEREFEILSSIVLHVSRYLGSVNYLFLLFAAATIFPLMYLFYKERKITLIIAYICIPFFFIESFSVIRQAAAISFCFLAYKQYLDRNKNFFFIFLIAVGFHYSAIIFFLVILVFWFNLRIVKITIIIPLLLLAVYFEIIFLYLQQYFPTLAFYNAGTDFGLLSLLSIVILFFISLDKKERGEHYYLIIIGFILNVIVLNIDSSLARLSWYFYIPFCFLSWSRFFWVVKVDRVIFLLMMLVYFSYALFTKSNLEYGAFIPYKTLIGG